MSFVLAIYDTFFSLLRVFKAPLLFIARLYWGFLLVQLGWEKLHTLESLTIYFDSLGITQAALAAQVVAYTEFLGGISLIFGLASRFFSLSLVILFGSAYTLAHGQEITDAYLYGATELQGLLEAAAVFVKEDAFHYLMISTIVLFTGPGCLSIDAYIRRRCCSPCQEDKLED